MTLNELYSLHPEIQQKFEEFEKQENVTYKDISSYLLNFKELQYTKKALLIKNNGEIAIKIAQLIHKDHYDYTYADFNNPNQKTKIICNYCGEEICTDFSHHISGKGGCRKCNNPRKITTEIFIERANKVHNNKYDYSKTIYKNLYEPVIIICPEEGHGEYLQKPSDHLAGCGCQKCHPQKVKRT